MSYLKLCELPLSCERDPKAIEITELRLLGMDSAEETAEILIPSMSRTSRGTIRPQSRILSDSVRFAANSKHCSRLSVPISKPRTRTKTFITPVGGVPPKAKSVVDATRTAFPVRIPRRDHRSRISIASNPVWCVPWNRGHKD